MLFSMQANKMWNFLWTLNAEDRVEQGVMWFDNVSFGLSLRNDGAPV